MTYVTRHLDMLEAKKMGKMAPMGESSLGWSHKYICTLYTNSNIHISTGNTKNTFKTNTKMGTMAPMVESSLGWSLSAC